MANLLQLLTMARSTKASFLVGLVAAAIVVGLQAYGVAVPMDTAIALVGAVTALAAHLVPDSAKEQVDALAKRLNISADQLASMVPQIQAVYPNTPSGPSNVSNINK